MLDAVALRVIGRRECTVVCWWRGETSCITGFLLAGHWATVSVSPSDLRWLEHVFAAILRYIW